MGGASSAPVSKWRKEWEDIRLSVAPFFELFAVARRAVVRTIHERVAAAAQQTRVHLMELFDGCLTQCLEWRTDEVVGCVAQWVVAWDAINHRTDMA